MEKEEKKVTKKSGLGIAWIILLVVLGLAILTFIIAPLMISGLIFIILYLPVMLYILIYKWIDRWFAAIVFTFSIWLNILVILIPITGGLLDFAAQPKYVLLEDNTPFFGLTLNTNSDSQQFAVLNNNQLDEVKSEITSEVKDKVIFVVNKEVFRDIDTIQVPDLGITITKDEIFDLLKSDNPNRILIRKLSPGSSLPAEMRSSNPGSGDQIKAMALMLLLQKTIEQNGAEYLVDELKDGNIKVYPKRASLNILIKVIPSSLVKDFLPDFSDIAGSNNNQMQQRK